MSRTAAACSTTERPRPIDWAGRGSKRRGRAALATVAALGLTLAACAGSSPSPEEATPSSAATTPRSSPGTTTASEWAEIDRGLAELGPDVGLLAASVSPDGTCEPIHEVASSTARPIGSQFKLFVLGALVEKIAAGEITWDQTVTVQDAAKSLGNGEGSLQAAAPGSSVTVEEAATKMISISDNTAADLLIELVSRDDVEAQAQKWMADASANDPFLTTRQAFLLHYVPGLADRYVATPEDERDAFLAAEVDPHPITDVGLGLSAEPRYVDTVEWFASPHDVCGAFAGLQQLSTTPSSAPLSTILSLEDAGIELDPSAWPTVWYKGGSEPGVLTLGWLATDSEGQTFVVEAMVTNPEAALSEDSILQLRDLAREAFGLLG